MIKENTFQRHDLIDLFMISVLIRKFSVDIFLKGKKHFRFFFLNESDRNESDDIIKIIL